MQKSPRRIDRKAVYNSGFKIQTTVSAAEILFCASSKDETSGNMSIYDWYLQF